MHIVLWLENLNGRDYSEELRVDEKIILEWILGANGPKDRYCAEELLILLINFMKKMKSEQAILPNPCLEEEEEEEDD
jgi:hypothetical protein